MNKDKDREKYSVPYVDFKMENLILLSFLKKGQPQLSQCTYIFSSNPKMTTSFVL